MSSSQQGYCWSNLNVLTSKNLWRIFLSKHIIWETKILGTARDVVKRNKILNLLGYPPTWTRTPLTDIKIHNHQIKTTYLDDVIFSEKFFVFCLLKILEFIKSFQDFVSSCGRSELRRLVGQDYWDVKIDWQVHRPRHPPPIFPSTNLLWGHMCCGFICSTHELEGWGVRRGTNLERCFPTPSAPDQINQVMKERSGGGQIPLKPSLVS